MTSECSGWTVTLHFQMARESGSEMKDGTGENFRI